MLEKKGIDLMSYMHMNLGNGLSTSFWDDNWCTGGNLKNLFLRVYALENNKRISVRDKLVYPTLNQSLRKWPRGGAEVSQMEKLKNMIDPVSLKQGKDSWVWSMNTSGMYSVASVRNLIDSCLLPSSGLKTRLPNKNKVMLEGIFFVTWWLLWNFRNKKIFEGKSPYKAMFFDDVICKAFYWCRYRSKKVFSWDEWFKNPHLISL
nr:hypothetical protein [Tanacetum cinerariifolium]